MNLKRSLTLGFYGMLSIILLTAATFLMLTLMRYSLNGVGWEVAKKAAALSDINLCKKIWVVFNPLGLSPGTQDQRNDCIYEYARITKDPSACELLMPSSYGLSCVGAAQDSHLCIMNDDTVSWHENEELKEMSYTDCNSDPQNVSAENSACCLIAQVSFVRNANDCSKLKSNTPFFDECQHRLAFKNHDPASCEPISNVNIRTACIVESKALKQDPSICSGCSQPVDNIEDLMKN